MPELQPESRELTRRLAAWFLGPKAENATLEEEMVLFILRDYFHWRRNYYPSDEIIITQQMRRDAVEFNDALFQELNEMLARLKRHFPFYSPRYIAHMLSDQTIPSVLGYFAGMLYNPNNVTPEAAPVTVEWELEVAADILQLLGYRKPPAAGAHHRETRQEFGWAHITSGGTVANLEALWVARAIRYFPLAVQEAAVRGDVPLAVKLPGTTTPVPISDVSREQLMRLKPNSATFLLPRFIEAVRHHYGVPDTEATARAWQMLHTSPYHLRAQGTARAFAEFPPVLFAPGTAHYSVTKAADILGMGRENVWLVDVDNHYRMEVRDLEEKILRAMAEGYAPVAVVAVAGTTEEGAVDPVHRIEHLRKRLEAEHQLSVWLHVDAAWGGYIRSVLVTPDGAVSPPGGFVSRTLEIRRANYARTIRLQWGSDEVVDAFLAFPRAESITVDPHKMGYVPYPCGVIAFRNDRVRHYLTQEAPYITVTTEENVQARVYHPPANIGPFILEGSKPGAAAAACWLSHRMIPPDRTGYGEICRASLLAARELHERLVHWDASCRANHEQPPFFFVPASKSPPDTNIVCFLVVPRQDATLRRANALGEAVYHAFTIEAELGDRDYSYSQPFFISRTRFHPPQYSTHAVADLLRRAGLDPAPYPEEGIFVLRATVMSPYLTLAAETGHRQALLGEFVEHLARTALRAVSQLNSAGLA